VTDSVKLTVPHTRPYHHVVHLVVGGLATRLNLSYEHLEDLQLALDGLLGNDGYAAGDEITVEVAIREEGIEMLIGPLDAGKLEPDLAERDEPDAGVGLRRLLTTVVAGVEVERRDGAGWVRFRKEVPGGKITART
jgi:anti-sigma regulatory factor (Ser/Thr protein kinase)